MYKHIRGQTLVEAVVVIGVVVLLATGLVAGTTASLRSAQSGRARSQAVALAQEGIEVTRGLRDEQWSSFQANTGYYCLGSEHVLSPYASEECPIEITTPQGSFGRSVHFNWQDPIMIVTVKVRYIDGTVTRNATLVTHFTQWR